MLHLWPLAILNVRGKNLYVLVKSLQGVFLVSAMIFPFSAGTDGVRDNVKKLRVIEADTAKLIFTLHTLQFAVQLILFSKEGENTSLLRSSLCAAYVWNTLQM